jgi:hypothetical protein
MPNMELTSKSESTHVTIFESLRNNQKCLLKKLKTSLSHQAALMQSIPSLLEDQKGRLQI